MCPFVAFPATYVFSVLAGVLGGHVGWKYGLACYFGVHVGVTIGSIWLAAFELRQIFRFSLRTLLIATTLIAFVLGAVVYSLG